MSPITARFEAGEPTDGLHGKHGKPLINWARDIASGRAAEQPPPDQAQQRERSIQGMVISDLVTRMEVGKQRYGTYLHAGNGRDALRDAYEEALDLACYLKQAIEERDWAQRNDGAVIEDPK